MNTSEQTRPPAMLIVTMEPPADLEDEFNDWYDLEHFPQRVALPGFAASSRWVCIEGWPRYLALYDLASVDAVKTPEYLACSGPGATPWTRRVVARTLGRQRIVAEEIGAVGRPGAVSRLLGARFPSAGQDVAQALLALRVPGLQSIRCLQSEQEQWTIATFARPVLLADLVEAFGTAAGVGATLFNLYVPYFRGG
jgi:hypothetical protein